MPKQHVEKLIQTALLDLQQAGKLPTEIPNFQIDVAKDKQHGDFACNIALILAKALQKKPREVAEIIVAALPASQQIKKIEIAGPGFINFYLTSAALYTIVREILAAGDQYGRSTIGNGKRILVEFVSANPNGPLHVGHGRHAAYGAVVSDLLETIGYDVHREYYLNDAGRQMDIVTTSTWLRYLENCGEKIIFPANAYKGEYVIDIAKKLFAKNSKKLCIAAEKVFQGLPKDLPEGGDKEIYIDAMIARTKELLGHLQYDDVFALVLSTIQADIKADLEEFGVHYQSWFSEKKFTESDAVDRTLSELVKKELIYERDGALWFRSTNYGDEKDRVLQRSNGVRTYFANDFAYHVNKFERGFDHAIDIFGADHHGYIPRMKAGLEACGISPDKLTYLLLQFVTLYRGRQQVQMSTRSGSFVTLRELREEVGNDAARFFYVMRKCEQHIDFDLDLAKSKSNENPVYYIQYAHARICSVFKQLQDKSIQYDKILGEKSLTLLNQSHELTLLSTLGSYKNIIMNAATYHEPHILTNYLRDLATDFHAYYNSHQFLVDDDALRNARLTLISAARQVIANGLKLVGVRSPETM